MDHDKSKTEGRGDRPRGQPRIDNLVENSSLSSNLMTEAQQPTKHHTSSSLNPYATEEDLLALIRQYKDARKKAVVVRDTYQSLKMKYTDLLLNIHMYVITSGLDLEIIQW